MTDYAPMSDLPDAWSIDTEDGQRVLVNRHDRSLRLAVDWNDSRTRSLVSGGRRHPLYRAAGMHQSRNRRIVDATGGLGTDAFLLGSLGASVTVIERDPVVFALLEDAWLRAGSPSHTCPVHADSVRWLTRNIDTQAVPVEIVYLDPMYPATRKTAAPRQEIRVLRAYFRDRVDQAPTDKGEAADGYASTNEALLEAALAAASWRVVVKRPPGAATIDGRQPDATVGSKLVRFDLYQARP